MATALDGQVEVNGLLMGPGTPYMVIAFNPYNRSTRSAMADRAWGAGSWSGREDTESVAVPLRLHIDETSDTTWLAAQQTLASALKASSTDVELRWRVAGVEYLMFVRPRVVEPSTEWMQHGHGPVSCALIALDPAIYAASEKSVELGLPVTSGGLEVPFTVPFTIAAATTSGRATITNSGTETTGLTLRVDAFGSPLVEPRISLISGSVTSVLRVHATLDADQWLDIDTSRRTVYLNGTSTRRGSVSGTFPLLPPGESELAFDASAYSAVAKLTATWRDTYA